MQTWHGGDTVTSGLAPLRARAGGDENHRKPCELSDRAVRKPEQRFSLRAAAAASLPVSGNVTKNCKKPTTSLAGLVQHAINEFNMWRREYFALYLQRQERNPFLSFGTIHLIIERSKILCGSLFWSVVTFYVIFHLSSENSFEVFSVLWDHPHVWTVRVPRTL